MPARPTKTPLRIVVPTSSSEEGTFSDSGLYSGSEEKTIPFLRRLRDMLQENENVISFVPGYRSGSKTVLGRIIVHDRLQVECNVLPRYFNHNSFASLRRQLNYFSFVRLGAGRQRESEYLNHGVVELDDILTLKRRSSTGGGGGRAHSTSSSSSSSLRPSAPAVVVPDDNNNNIKDSEMMMNNQVESTLKTMIRPQQRRKSDSSTSSSFSKQQRRPRSTSTASTTTTAPSSSSSVISEDDEHALDLTTTTGTERKTPTTGTTTDEDILEGCVALLGLSTYGWWPAEQ